MYGALINAAIGLVLGLIPLITGVVKRNVKYGVIGFLGSIVGGAILGIFLAVPVAALFTWLIIRGPKTPAAPDLTSDDPNNS